MRKGAEMTFVFACVWDNDFFVVNLVNVISGIGGHWHGQLQINMTKNVYKI